MFRTTFKGYDLFKLTKYFNQTSQSGGERLAGASTAPGSTRPGHSMTQTSSLGGTDAGQQLRGD